MEFAPMSQRVSYSLLDPWISGPLKATYSWLPIPRRLPPEAIVLCGHLAAITGAVGFALSAQWAWAGVLAAVGVALNHTCDVLDGAHARATGQCRNGGELLDHFVDPLSFAYWSAGIAFSATAYASWSPWVGLAGVVVIFATAVLTNIRAKMIGEFTLARFGPTEFKSLLVAFGLVQAVLVRNEAISANGVEAAPLPAHVALWFMSALVVAGGVQLVLGLWRAVREVNALGTPADTTEWINRG
jgi:phosphatidylglycerophosphate synthase